MPREYEDALPRDGAGRARPSNPGPTVAGRIGTLQRAAGELLPDPPPAGRYRLRFAGSAPPLVGAWSRRIESPWVEFVVGAR